MPLQALSLPPPQHLQQVLCRAGTLLGVAPPCPRAQAGQHLGEAPPCVVQYSAAGAVGAGGHYGNAHAGLPQEGVHKGIR
jgi:hypothetical protein